MPEKSGMDAALRAPILAGAAVGATCCAHAGVTAAANATANSQSRFRFMSISPSWLASASRPRSGARLVDRDSAAFDCLLGRVEHRRVAVRARTAAYFAALK